MCSCSVVKMDLMKRFQFEWTERGYTYTKKISLQLCGPPPLFSAPTVKRFISLCVVRASYTYYISYTYSYCVHVYSLQVSASPFWFLHSCVVPDLLQYIFELKGLLTSILHHSVVLRPYSIHTMHGTALLILILLAILCRHMTLTIIWGLLSLVHTSMKEKGTTVPSLADSLCIHTPSNSYNYLCLL